MSSTSIFKHQATLLKALSHPSRLAVTNILRQCPLTVHEMQEMTGLPQAKLSQHLQILRREQIVMAERNGKFIKYRLTHPDFLRATDLVRGLVSQRYNIHLTPRAIVGRATTPKTNDPVCGMATHPATAAFISSHKGTTLYFCGQGCLKRFQRHPEQYIN